MTNLVPLYATLLILGGQAGLPLLVITFLSKGVHRHPTFINFCITMIIYSVVFCLVFYTTEYNDTPTPSDGLCLAQASMITGAFPMASTAALAVVFEIWATCQDPDSSIFNTVSRTSSTVILILMPYLAFAGFTTMSAVLLILLGLRMAFIVPFNCIQSIASLRPSVSLVIVTAVVFFEVAIMTQWYRRWHQLKRSFPLANRRPDTMLCFRVVLFNSYTIVTLATAIPFATNAGAHAASYMVDAGLPLATFLVFGTQRDIFIAWGISKELPDLTRRDSTCSVDSLSQILPASEGRRPSETSLVPHTNDSLA